MGELVLQQLRQHGGPPLAQGVGRAARPGKNPARLAYERKRRFESHGTGTFGPQQRGDLHLAAHGFAEIGHSPGGDVLGIGLETVGRVEQDGGYGGRAEAVKELTVDLGHRRGRLARPHYGQETDRVVHRCHPKVPRARPIACQPATSGPAASGSTAMTTRPWETMSRSYSSQSGCSPEIWE